MRITGQVDSLLDEVERNSDGVEAGIAVHGRRVVAHLVMRRLGDKFLRDPDSDVDKALGELKTEVAGYVQAMVGVFPTNAYPGNVFKNQARVADLVKDSGLTP